MRGGAPGNSGVSRDPRDDDGRFLERDGCRWYRIGDRVRCVEGGELAYLDRLDGQVQVQGWRSSWTRSTTPCGDAREWTRR